ncbi:MAG TPA: acyltransferase [Xanthobacteraceae bacterium]|jgi:fucose 4-O-acetylase-like acetyltransferase
MSKTSLALGNVRSVVILLVISFHSVLAYLSSQPASTFPFDTPPYGWKAFPILDNERWFGFDLYCAFQYVFLMPFMFFLSGLFVWPSLSRKGARRYLTDRLLRLGLPFVLGVTLIMPIAHYPVYRVTAVDPSWSAYWAHFTALPFWPSGPLWFLWQLLVLDIAAAALYRLEPRAGELLGQVSGAAGGRPGHYFLALLIASGLAYVPLALMFRPWEWAELGPFSFQTGRVLHYMVYFFSGVGVGALGLDRGLLRTDGMLSLRWARWLGGASVAFVLWLIATALTLQPEPIAGTRLAADLAFVLSSASACVCFLAVFLRFAGKRWPLPLDSVGQNAYGMYLVHYLFAVWLQYMLLGTALFALLKGAIVFSGASLLSWAVAAALCRVPAGAQLIRGQTARAS